MDLLKLIQKIPFVPPIFNDKIMDKYGYKVAMPQITFPTPSFALKQVGPDGRSLPQAIAHRGYKAKYPENTISAFEDAVEAGAHALETDLHLTRDGIVVLSHDADLKRCFGVDKNIKDCDWVFLETLRTSQTPYEPLARLVDLLKLFSRSEWQGIWLLLDIKIDDEPKEMMHYIAESFKQVGTGNISAWKDRLVLGFWTAQYIPLCDQYFSGFPIINTGFSSAYSRQFLDIPEIGFNILQASVVFPWGRRFVHELQAQNRQLYTWTVNDEKNMDWCIRQQVDGVVTDNIPKFLKMCETFEEQRKHHWPVRLLLGFAYFNIWVFLFDRAFFQRYGSCTDRRVETYKSK